MAAHAADLNLLFAVLALQNELVERDELLAAINAWGLEKHRLLGDILVERGALPAADRQLLDGLIARQLQRHGTAEKSLAAVPVSSALKAQVRSLCHPDLAASLAVLGAAGDAFATVSQAPADSGVRYRILRAHARGGLGEVFVAEDTELHREVALKEMQAQHTGHDASRGRFVLEAEITGGLEHPGIVPVYGLGSYADGRPFYAMRFIKGDNLKEATTRFHGGGHDPAGAVPDYAALEFRQLLGRFIDVCNAIAYAHSRGVLHRDLKPGNIMLGKFGETLVVDWGLAKVVGAGPDVRAAGMAEEATLKPYSGSAVVETLAGSAIGTPAYMSPEQAAGKVDELGPATDVYSLGATLFALLMNRPPVRGADTAEVLRKVQRGEIDWHGSAHRQPPAALLAVCKKAMALAPAERYATPLALAEDLEHWLADEPVTAQREPMAVRARRWVRKHRTFVTSAAAVVLVAAVGATAAAALLMAANDRLNAANDDLTTANTQLDAANGRLQTAYEKLDLAHQDAEKKREEAERQRQIAVAVRTFLQRDLLRQADPSHQANQLLAAREKRFATNENPTIRELLDRAATQLTPAQIERKFPGQPLVQAEILQTVGNSYRGAGDFAAAVKHLERARPLYEAALGPDHPDTLTCMADLAESYRAADQLKQAVALFKETFTRRKAVLGPDHADTLSAMNSLAESYMDNGKVELALPLSEEAVKRSTAKLGRDHPDTLMDMNVLAMCWQHAGKVDQAVQLHDETLRRRTALLGDEHPDTVTSMNNLASSYEAAGKHTLALPLYEKALKLVQTLCGPNHPDTLIGMHNLALAYQHVRKYDLALSLQEAAFTRQRARLGPGHRNTLSGMATLIACYRDAGQHERAVALAEEMLTIVKAKLRADDPRTLVCMHALGVLCGEVRQFDRAVQLLQECLNRRAARSGPSHRDTLAVMHALAFAYQQAGKLDQAIALYEKTVRLRKGTLGPSDAHTLLSMHNLAFCYRAARRLDRAVPLAKQVLEARKATLGINHRDTLTSMATLALVYEGRPDLALPLHEKTFRRRLATLGPKDADTLASMADLARFYLTADKLALAGADMPQKIDKLALAYKNAGKWAHAVALYKEALRLRKTKLGIDDADTLVNMSNLAQAYQNSGKLSLAMPLYEETLPRLKAKLGIDDFSTLAAMNNLATAYQASRKLDTGAAALRGGVPAHEGDARCQGPDHAHHHEQPGACLFAARPAGEGPAAHGRLRGHPAPTDGRS